MRAACVSSVLCMRVLVCKAQGSERGRGRRGEGWASPVRTSRKSGKKSGLIWDREIGRIASRAYGFFRAGVVPVRKGK